MKNSKFIPGTTYVRVSGKVFDQEEINNAIKVARDGWWTEGEFGKRFENDFKKFMGVRYVSLVNSGSSANLSALAALTSEKFGEKRLKAGDEFITTAVAFPTTVNPALLYGLKPVFIDSELDTLNANIDQLEKAITKKTRLIMMAHTLGKPYNLDAVMRLVKKHGLWLIEDCCDALGSKYGGQLVGTFGHVATFSFYPAHQMSCSFDTPVPYLDEKGIWNLDTIEKLYFQYVNNPKKIKVLSFDKNSKVNWTTPSSILRYKLGSVKKMYRVTTQHGRFVDVTQDHSIFVINKETAEIEAKKVNELTLDDFIVSANFIPTPQPVTHLNTLDYFKNLNTYVSNFSHENLKNVKNWDYRWQFKSRNTLPIKYFTSYDLNKEKIILGISQSNKIPATILVNEELCRLIGYFLAEGSYQNGLIFSFNKAELDLIEDVIMIAKNKFNLKARVSKTYHNISNVEIESKNIEIVFKDILKIKKGAKNKRIPWFLYHTDEKCIKSFIYAYTKGDGSIKKLKNNTYRIDVTSVSKELLNDFQYLLSRIGISASFYRRNKSNKDKLIKQVKTSSSENYSLCFSGYNYSNKTIKKQNLKERNNLADQIPLLPIFRRYISVSKKQEIISKKRLLKYLKSNSQLYSLVNNNLTFFKVRKIEKIDYDKDQYVYDFSVPGKENFYGGFLGTFLHNTMGEGGAVITNNPLIHMAIRQFRDWGRDCWCDTGRDDTCRRRFGWKLGALPHGYDHKYIYSQIGYNLKLTDFQAAIGVAQLKKLPNFIKKRKSNFKKYFEFFQKYQKFFILMKTGKYEDPCWFGFPVVVRSDAPFTRNELTEYLEKQKIGTRNIFSGNLLRHPAYKNIKYKTVETHSDASLQNADRVMNDAFWLGVFPEIDIQRIKYVKEKIKNFLSKY